LYLPMTAKLGADKTNQGLSYPEYDRLFSGQLQKDTLTVGLVEGFRDHGAEDESDSGFTQFMDQLKETFAGRKWSVVSTSPQVDILSYTVEGKSVSFASFNELYDAFYGSGGSLTSLQRASLKKEIGKKVIRNWITFESLATVKIGSAAARPVRLRMQAYLGSADVSIHKKMIRSSDVFIYDGHSQIGYGPLDPANFKASDFTSTYQIFFIDGCVSYNYYEKDYIPLKQGGTKNLDLITNGLEVPSFKSGYAIGKLMNLLLKGKASYADLIRATASTDKLRVVDGELDNVYSPTKTPISVE
ncbi:MAG: hypothetical protein KBF88_02100, partial [Polyangiaceae bacterium]|nr:hypothetical protein [Polyangiaceae bacterium]